MTMPQDLAPQLLHLTLCSIVYGWISVKEKKSMVASRHVPIDNTVFVIFTRPLQTLQLSNFTFTIEAMSHLNLEAMTSLNMSGTDTPLVGDYFRGLGREFPKIVTTNVVPLL